MATGRTNVCGCGKKPNYRYWGSLTVYPTIAEYGARSPASGFTITVPPGTMDPDPAVYFLTSEAAQSLSTWLTQNNITPEEGDLICLIGSRTDRTSGMGLVSPRKDFYISGVFRANIQANGTVRWTVAKAKYISSPNSVSASSFPIQVGGYGMVVYGERITGDGVNPTKYYPSAGVSAQSGAKFTSNAVSLWGAWRLSSLFDGTIQSVNIGGTLKVDSDTAGDTTITNVPQFTPILFLASFSDLNNLPLNPTSAFLQSYTSPLVYQASVANASGAPELQRTWGPYSSWQATGLTELPSFENLWIGFYLKRYGTTGTNTGTYRANSRLTFSAYK